ncbi:MAG TPA: hypothetical protein VMZ31_01090 [Phycisphaerae bacterium]|nr:hypothetical protein [Phycisphaerae bacterium]
MAILRRWTPIASERPGIGRLRAGQGAFALIVSVGVAALAGCGPGGQAMAERGLLLVQTGGERASVPLQKLHIYDPQTAASAPAERMTLLGQEWPLELVCRTADATFLATQRVRDTVDRTHQELVEVDLQQRRIATVIDRFDRLLWVDHNQIVYGVGPDEGVTAAMARGGRALPAVESTGYRLMRYWITGNLVEEILDRPLCMLHRLDGTRCVALVTRPRPVLVMLDWFTGQHAEVFRLPPGAAISASVLSEDRQALLLALQFAGRPWDLFDLYWIHVPNRSATLIRANVPCPLDRRSRLAPRLPLAAIDTDRIVLVEAEVTRRDAEGVPLDGQYYTVIMKLPTRRVLQRVRHPTEGLSEAPPEPYLPTETLARLGLPAPLRASVWPSGPNDDPILSACDEAATWRQFLDYRDGQLWLDDRTSFAPDEIDMFEPSPGGRALAARVRSSGGEELLVVHRVKNGKASFRFPLDSISQLHWLPSPED